MSSEELKTSEEWYNLPEYNHITIYDPDGWDRDNFKFSFKKELISEAEFIDRINRSTILLKENDQ